jgi:hypothetical protein
LTVLVKDANTTTQSISTQAAAANLVPVNMPSSLVGTVATPVSPTAPLPVINTSSAAVDGSGTITRQTVAQQLFSGVTPANGFLISNNTASALLIIDNGTSANNVGIQVPANSVLVTPSGYKPIGPVSIYGGVTAGNFTARRW